MYGVFWITPPHVPATIVATASVRRTSRARYSSPATRADSVLSIPPTTVASAKGSASGRYASTSSMADTHPSVGHGGASANATSGAGCAPPPPPSHRAQNTAVPASTATSAPGTPPGSLTPPTSVANTSTSE